MEEISQDEAEKIPHFQIKEKHDSNNTFQDGSTSSSRFKNFRNQITSKCNWILTSSHDIIESKMQKLYTQVGWFCSSYPWTVLLICSLIVFVSSFGIRYIDFGEPVAVVWVPDGSKAKAHNDYRNNNYGDLRLVSAIIVGNPEGKDLIDQNALIEVLHLHQKIMSIEVKEGKGPSYRYDDICFKPFPLSPCLVSSVLSYWDFNEEKIRNDTDLHKTISNSSKNGLLAPTIDLEYMVGGIEKETVGNSTLVRKGKALTLAYFIKESRDIWESIKMWENEFSKVTHQHQSRNFDIFSRTRGSQKQEVQRATKKDAPLFIVSFSLMIVYITIALGKRDLVGSKALLGLSGVISIILALIMSFGICGYIGATYSSAVIAVPFLILGIGTDDMFIIVNAFDRTNPRLDLKRRVQISLVEVGSSITLTSLTDFIAFFAGSTSSLPALSGFCLFCAFAVLCDFLLQVTFFVACMSLNQRRVESGRVDCLPCIKLDRKGYYQGITDDEEGTELGSSSSESEEIPTHVQLATDNQTSSISRFFINYYGPFLLNPIVKWVIILISLSFFSLSIYGATQLSSGLSEYDVLPQDSILLRYIQMEEKYFEGLDYQIDFVFQTFDYSDPRKQDLMLQFYDEVEKSSFVRPPVSSWLKDYLEYIKKPLPPIPNLPVDLLPFPGANLNLTLDANGRPKSERDFYLYLYRFLADPFGGMKHASNIILQYGFIKTSRFVSHHVALNTDVERADAILEMRRICNKYQVDVNTGGSGIFVFPFSYRYLFWEQYINMVQSNMINFAFVAVAIFLFTLMFLGKLSSTLVVMVSLLGTIVDLLGMMWLWDIGLNNVSLVNLLLSLGLAVDACTHIVHCTNEEAIRIEREGKNKHNKQKQAIIHGLGNLGASVFSGTFTSFLGICILGIADHTILRIFFKFFFSVFLLAIFHGLALTPILMSFLK